MIKTIFFDLDGTLLPMDQDIFLKDYFGRLIKKMIPHGYDPDRLQKSIWACTGAMVQNNGTCSNENVFWNRFSEVYSSNIRRDESVFLEFYEKEFQEVRSSCGFNPLVSDAIQELKHMGLRLVLATNPLFPAVATKSRVFWAGLDPDDFEWITTYENASYCKPNPGYYQEILDKLQLSPEECLMVGNDVAEDMIAEVVGIHVFLLTDCLINKQQEDISSYPNGGFPELMDFIRRVC